MSRSGIAEALGTGLLLYIIVGSGIAVETLGGGATTQLLAHALAVGLGLGVLIAIFQTVSGSHFNPAVTTAFWRSGSVDARTAAGYWTAQFGGGLAGVVLAHLSFEMPAVSISVTARTGSGLVIAEAVATSVLVFSILALVRTGRAALVPATVGGWVAAIIFATSSTGFANPAVTVARVFTDSHTGIAPGSIVGFLVAQACAALIAAPLARYLFPDPVHSIRQEPQCL